MDARTLARLAAVQALYEREANGTLSNEDEQDLGAKAKQMALFNDLNRINKKIFEQIITTVSRETHNIDEKIKSNLAEGWSFERIGGVLRAVLRAASGEKLSAPETPNSVIISEFTGITAGFYDEKEVKFVQGILNKILG